MEALVYDDGFRSETKFTQLKPIKYIISSDQWQCWNCISHTKDKDGYIKISRNGKHLRLHRYVYELEKGEIPNGYVVQHLCDNPSCFKPEHLVASTQLENTRQAYYKNRRKHVRDKEGKFITDTK